MGPNRGGGQHRKGQSEKEKNTPARARFSNWKPPSKNVKAQFSKQKQNRNDRKNSSNDNSSNQVASEEVSNSQIVAMDRIILPENVIRSLMSVFGQEYGSSNGTKGISLAKPISAVHKGNALPLPPPPCVQSKNPIASSVNVVSIGSASRPPKSDKSNSVGKSNFKNDSSKDNSVGGSNRTETTPRKNGDASLDADAPIVPPELVRPWSRHMDTIEYKTAYNRALSNGLTGASAQQCVLEELEYILPASAMKELTAEVKYAVAMLDRRYSIKDMGTRETIEGCKLLMERMAPYALNKAQCKELYQSAKDSLFKTGQWYARDANAMQDKLVLTGMMIYAERLEKKKQKKNAKSVMHMKGEIATTTTEDKVASELSSILLTDTPRSPPPEAVLASSQIEVTGADEVEALEPEKRPELTAEEVLAQKREEEHRRLKQAKDSEMMLKGLEAKQKNPKYRDMLAKRKDLPAFKQKREILKAIEEHSVVVVSGDTGCGKTTQIPQLVLDDWIAKGVGGKCNIIVTQPRRISAVSVAEHISRERTETLGQSTGYHIRLEMKKGPSTRLLLMTTGVLLRRLQTDTDLEGVSHVFVDEVHERDINTDFLLIVLKQLLQRKPNLKVILMSATLNANMFVDYFSAPNRNSQNDSGTVNCTLVSIPGRTFPVTTFYLEDALEHTGFEIRPGSDYVYTPPKSGRSSGGENNQNKVKNKSMEPQQLRIEREHLIRKLQDQRSLSCRTVQSLKLVDESVLNLDLIQELVVHLIHTQSNAAVDNGSDKNNQKKKQNRVNKPESSSGNSGENEVLDEKSSVKQRQNQAEAILIFVPGLSDIRAVCDVLEQNPALNGKTRILPLHSALSSHEQSLVFQLPPGSKRKIIVSTNIAETSVTIEDVVYVIDTCRVKENSFDEETQMNVLEEKWCSQANMRQRRGRAGRVRAGVCYHLCCSFTSSLLPAYTVPEMRRMSLEELILQVLALDLGNPYEFLRSALSPPASTAVTNAVLFLESLNAVIIESAVTVATTSASNSVSNKQLNERQLSCQITPLGFHLAALPITPRIGKLMLYGVLLRCVDPILTIAAVCSSKSPFVMPFNEREAADAAKLGFLVGHSDLMTALHAFNSWRSFVEKGRVVHGNNNDQNSSLNASEFGSVSQSPEQYCRSNFLSINALRLIEQMRGQFLNLLKDIGFMPTSVTCKNIQQCISNTYGNSTNMIKNAICAGLSPNILMMSNAGGGQESTNKPAQTSSLTASFGSQILQKPLGEMALKKRRKGTMSVHPSSVMFSIKRIDSKFMVYHESIKTSKVFACDVTTVTPLTVALFSGRLKCHEGSGYVLVDGWIKLICEAKVVKCLGYVTDAIDDAFEEKVLSPTKMSSDVWEDVLRNLEKMT